MLQPYEWQGFLKTCVPEAACWSEWALLLSSLTTSPILFSSVCIASPLLCSFPRTSVDAHPGPRPPPACAVRHWGVATAASAWAASAALRATSETGGGAAGKYAATPGKAACHLSAAWTKHLCCTSCSNSMSGNVCINNIWRGHGPCEPGRGRREWRVNDWLGWFTSLPALLKRCQKAVFHCPLPLRLKTGRHSQKTCF